MLEEYIELEIRKKYGDHAENFYVKNCGRRENVFFFFMFHSHIIFLTFRNCLLNLQKDFIAKNNDK